MISIKNLDTTKAPSKANVLPCRIKYTGPASSSRYLWNPITTSDSSTETDAPAKPEQHIAYFRGRKLAGTKLVLPEGYSGHIITTPSAGLPTSNQKRELLYQDDDQEIDLEEIETSEWVAESPFSEIMVWGHEVVVDDAQDGIVKGVGEWITMAGAIPAMGSAFLPHLHSGWHVDRAIDSEDEKLVVIRFGQKTQELVAKYAVIYLCDVEEVPDFNAMYELYDPCAIMFFYRNKHMQCDFGTGNNNKINWLLEDKQEMIDIKPYTKVRGKGEVWLSVRRITLPGIGTSLVAEK
ncbi:hypothetical protein ABW19_dt0210381 [Dactylella cylindrospora]|nr:hypothetical protein ABW19_dt0210381 [Dactylella cylindrospora]